MSLSSYGKKNLTNHYKEYPKWHSLKYVCVCIYTYTHIYILAQMIHIYDEQTWQKDWKEGIGEKGHHNNNKTPQQNLMLFHIVG